MKKKILKVTGAAAAGFGIFLELGWSFFNITVHQKRSRKDNTRKQWFQFPEMKKNHPRNNYPEEYDAGKAWCMQQTMQDCYMKSQDGLLLHASYLPAKDPKRTILLSHGYRGTSFNDFAYISKFLHENNCNLLFIDQRCCGKSEGEYITFGALEKQDVKLWTDYIAKRNKRRLPIYLYGESMGAATVLMASGLKLNDDVKGIISDCGFSSMKGQLKDIAHKWFHIKWPELLIFRIDILCRVVAKFRMDDADVTKALRRNKRPILFFHGDEDTFVYPDNASYNYAICKAPKELIVVNGARHISSVYVEPDLYKQKLLEFFEKYD